MSNSCKSPVCFGDKDKTTIPNLHNPDNNALQGLDVGLMASTTVVIRNYSKLDGGMRIYINMQDTVL